MATRKPIPPKPVETSVETDPADVLAQTHNILYVAGLDEAGRGPIAGPVVAAAVVLDPEHPIAGLNDSKKLNATKRAALVPLIEKYALAYGIAQAEPAEIDATNILQASLAAMARATVACEEMLQAKRGKEQTVGGAVVDGNQRAPLPTHIVQQTVVDGDAKSQPIMAASILAKEHRDAIMRAYDTTYPGYGLAQHMGYPTKAHLDALAKLGPSPIHRRSFGPVKQMTLL